MRVESLLASRTTGTPHDAELSAWLRNLPDAMHERLARTGLVEPRSDATMNVGELLERFDANATVKPSTRATYEQTYNSLREHLGAAVPLVSVKPLHADEWRTAMTDAGLATATVAKRVRTAKGIFARAVKWELIASNPFDHLRAGSQVNPDRSFYVSRETIVAILDACPDDQWRGIVALARYAGLRCPSEIFGLRWGDVNWERGRLNVRSPKTAGHGEGHAERVVPIAPELRSILLTLFDQAEPSDEAIIPRVCDSRTNLRTMFHKIISRAGEKPWPRLFQNLRASCETDWVEAIPAHAVAGWLGHSPRIAARHYLHIRDAHFDLVTQSGAECGAFEAQIAAQHRSAPVRAASHKSAETSCLAVSSHADANKRNAARTQVATPRGHIPLFSRIGCARFDRHKRKRQCDLAGAFASLSIDRNNDPKTIRTPRYNGVSFVRGGGRQNRLSLATTNS